MTKNIGKPTAKQQPYLYIYDLTPPVDEGRNLVFSDTISDGRSPMVPCCKIKSDQRQRSKWSRVGLASSDVEGEY